MNQNTKPRENCDTHEVLQILKLDGWKNSTMDSMLHIPSNAPHCISFQNIMKESIKLVSFSTFYISAKNKQKEKERINPTELKGFQYIVGATIHGVYSTADSCAAEHVINWTLTLFKQSLVPQL
jgi:hypothetical protein